MHSILFNALFNYLIGQRAKRKSFLESGACVRRKNWNTFVTDQQYNRRTEGFGSLVTDSDAYD